MLHTPYLHNCVDTLEFSKFDIDVEQCSEYLKKKVHDFSQHFFSSGLEQRGQEDDEGLKGFLPVDVLREWRRGQVKRRLIYIQYKY